MWADLMILLKQVIDFVISFIRRFELFGSMSLQT